MNIQIEDFKSVTRGSVKAEFTLVLPEHANMRIKNCALIAKKDGGYFVSFPQRKGDDGLYASLVGFEKPVDFALRSKACELAVAQLGPFEDITPPSPNDKIMHIPF